MSLKPTIFRLAAVLAAAGLAGGLPALAQGGAEPELSTSFSIAWASKYVWRGIPQTRSWAAQPSLTLAHGTGLSFNCWASRDGDKADFTEVDYTLNYSRNAGGATLNAGIVHYAFPNTSAPATTEAYLGVSGGGALSPSLTFNWDFDEADGIYAAVGVSRTVPANAGARVLQFTGRLGCSTARYNNYWFGVRSTAVSDAYIGASTTFQMGKVALTPSLGYSSIVSGKLRRSPGLQGLKRNNLVLTLAAGTVF